MSETKEMKYLNNLCGWLRNVKGITKVTVDELAGYEDEYKQYLELNN